MRSLNGVTVAGVTFVGKERDSTTGMEWSLPRRRRSTP